MGSHLRAETVKSVMYETNGRDAGKREVMGGALENTGGHKKGCHFFFSYTKVAKPNNQKH